MTVHNNPLRKLRTIASRTFWRDHARSKNLGHIRPRTKRLRGNMEAYQSAIEANMAMGLSVDTIGEYRRKKNDRPLPFMTLTKKSKRKVTLPVIKLPE